jgi:hypothetical protein
MNAKEAHSQSQTNYNEKLSTETKCLWTIIQQDINHAVEDGLFHVKIPTSNYLYETVDTIQKQLKRDGYDFILYDEKLEISW